MADVFDVWQARLDLSAQRSGRASSDQERDFWRPRAARYDEVGSLARVAPSVVDRVVQLIPPGATVLEIGPGTGAFTLPVAERASSVSAIDISPDMLAVLGAKAEALGVANVNRIEADWETCAFHRHDVVLAVNSLYRLRDARAAMRRLVESASQRGILVRSIGANPPPPEAARESFGSDRFDERSDHGMLVAGLAELGVAARVEIYSTPRVFRFQSLEEAAAVCLPWPNRTEAEWEIARGIARGTMSADEETGAVTYRYAGRVAIIWWDTDTRVSAA